MSKYRNVPGTEVIVIADNKTNAASIIYKGFTYDYFFIEDTLWDTFKNETNIHDWTEKNFNDWIFHNLKRVYNLFETSHINPIGQYVLI